MWWMWAAGAALASGLGAGATWAGYDAATQNQYDYYVCKSTAVYLATVESSTCVDGRTVYDLRVERTFKGTLGPVVQASSAGCEDKAIYERNGMTYQRVYSPRMPVILGERAVVFHADFRGPDGPLWAIFPEAYLVQTTDARGTFARISTVQRPTYVIDLVPNPMITVTEFDLDAPGVPPTTDEREGGAGGNQSLETASRLIQADAKAVATPWEKVLDQLEIVANRQPENCSRAAVNP